MAETRVKVYQWQAEQVRDEADALAQGWRVKRREPWENGTFRVTYEKGEHQRVTWAGVAMVALAVLTVIVLAGSR